MAVTIILLLTVTLATFAADRILPLGVAVWLLYLVPVVLTTQLLPQYTGVALGISSGLLLIGMLDPILVHPVPEGALVDLDLASHFGDRPGRLDHHLHGLVLEFRTELATTFSQ